MVQKLQSSSLGFSSVEALLIATVGCMQGLGEERRKHVGTIVPHMPTCMCGDHCFLHAHFEYSFVY